jgi:hypothetical protein
LCLFLGKDRNVKYYGFKTLRHIYPRARYPFMKGNCVEEIAGADVGLSLNCSHQQVYWSSLRWAWSHGGTIPTGEDRRTRTRTSPSAALSITNPIWTDPDANPCLRFERQATNHLSYGAACRGGKMYHLSTVTEVTVKCEPQRWLNWRSITAITPCPRSSFVTSNSGWVRSELVILLPTAALYLLHYVVRRIAMPKTHRKADYERNLFRKRTTAFTAKWTFVPNQTWEREVNVPYLTNSVPVINSYKVNLQIYTSKLLTNWNLQKTRAVDACSSYKYTYFYFTLHHH